MGCDLRATVQGHKRPDILAGNPICFIHTDAAIFAIDEDGVCCYVTTVTGEVPRNANRCRGAEYVACLDLTTDEGLVADPRIGGTGLFVGRGASQKMALLRTGPIIRVEFVEDDDAGQVSQIKPIDEVQRAVEAELARQDVVELDPTELEPMDETPWPASFAPKPRGGASNDSGLQLRVPTPPPRRSSRPPVTAPKELRAVPKLMDPADLLAAALRAEGLEQPVPMPTLPPADVPSTVRPSTLEVDDGWGLQDARKTRLGMPVVKLS